MKKSILLAIILLLVLGTAGCSKEKKMIKAEDVSESTILVKSDGKIQAATVEDFDKDYYKLSELQDYIENEVSAYNTKAGGEKVIIDEILLRDGKAIMVLSYTGMDQYVSFNEVTAAYFNGGIKDITLDLPTTLISRKNEALASTEEIIQNNKYRILVLNEPYHIIVDGEIKYYSENTEVIDKNEVKSAPEGMTIVAFKP